MTRSQLEAVVDALVEVVTSWNDAAEDEDRGRSNDWIHLTLADDGSGFIGRRTPSYEGPDGRTVHQIEDWHQFADLDDLVKVLVEQEGVELTPEGASA